MARRRCGCSRPARRSTRVTTGSAISGSSVSPWAAVRAARTTCSRPRSCCGSSPARRSRSSRARAAMLARARRRCRRLGPRAAPPPPDGALWYVQAVRAYSEQTIDAAFLTHIFPRLEAALETMVRGTRGGVSSDPSDGLLRAGEGDVDVTWMDAALRRAGLAPRHGKAVEVNALWYNAHVAMAAFARRLRRHVERWEARATRIETGFARFWNPAQQ